MTRTALVLFLSLLAFMALYPFIYMVLSSMKTSMEFISRPLSLPRTLYLDNYLALYYRYSLVRLYGNTLLSAAGALLLSLSLSIPASFAFAKLRFAYRDSLYLLFIGLMTVPGITFIIPNYLLMSRIGWLDHYISVIVIWGVTAVPFCGFLLTSLMKTLPDEVIEAARMDGASYMQLMRGLIVPMSVPGIVTISIFNMTTWWNDLLTPLIYLQSNHMKTMTVAVATMLGRFSSDYPLLLSGLVITSLPPLLMYVFLQGYIRKGLMMGAVKS